MTLPKIIEEISAKEIDLDKYVELTLDNGEARDEIIRQMVTHPHIMVYYHCYEVVSVASEKEPQLFYGYWPQIAPLLKHKNSYHRDIALTVLANLTRVDRDNLFAGVYADYIAHIRDEKFMTGHCFLRGCRVILQNRPEYRAQILPLLLDLDHQCTYTEKQKALLKCDVLEILAEVYEELADKTNANEFIQACRGSVSPKTRGRAKELSIKYHLVGS